MKIFVFGIDVSTPCGPLSNVDFTYLVLQNFERISSKQYAITLIPSNLDSFLTPPSLIDSTSLSTPRFLCLKYYRAASDGWRDAGNCDVCVEQYQACVSTHCGCNLSDTCFCRICLRQPPSLFGSALHVYTKMVHNLTHFQLTSDTTYEQYVYAIESIEADMHILLPPEFPELQIWFRYNHPDFEQKFHRDCPGAGDWHMETCHNFSNVFSATDSLGNEEETFLVSLLSSRSFSPNTCPDPLHIN